MPKESRRYVLSGRAGWVRLGIVVWLVFVVEFVGHSITAQGAMTTKTGQGLRFDHVVIVIEENKNFSDIIGNTADAPYINQLASVGASFTNAHGEWHPSQPNYFALFSGSTQGIESDDCPTPMFANGRTASLNQSPLNQSLGGELLKHKDPTYSFGTYSEQLPRKDLESCYAYEQNGQLTETEEQPKGANNSNDQYARRHNPWISFTDVPGEMIHDYWKDFPNPRECNDKEANAYSKLPTVSFVIPNNQNEMHTAANLAERIKKGDQWLNQNISCYVQWARSHNSLLIVTWDEDGSTDACDKEKTQPVICPVEMVQYPDKKHKGTTPESNQIPTIFVGAHVKPGVYNEWINHYNILRTLEQMYGLDYLGISASMQPIMDVWE